MWSGRQNANNVDLNRGFPTWDHLNLTYDQMKEMSEPEVVAIIDWVREPFVLGINFHDGAVVAAYGWDDSNGEDGVKVDIFTFSLYFETLHYVPY